MAKGDQAQGKKRKAAHAQERRQNSVGDGCPKIRKGEAVRNAAGFTDSNASWLKPKKRVRWMEEADEDDSADCATSATGSEHSAGNEDANCMKCEKLDRLLGSDDEDDEDMECIDGFDRASDSQQPSDTEEGSLASSSESEPELAIERESRHLEKLKARERALAEAETQEMGQALSQEVDGSDSGEEAGEVMEMGGSGLVIPKAVPDLSEVKVHIAETVNVLENFKSMRSSTTSRSTYVDRVGEENELHDEQNKGNAIVEEGIANYLSTLLIV